MLISIPTIDSIPGSGAERPDVVVPKTTSSSWLQRDSSTAQAPSSRVLTVSPCRLAMAASLAVAELSGLPIGLSVCYDLRFPELYRALEQAGALVLTVPAAFTLITGMAHWEPLLRARAIENQAFVLAADQHGDPGGYGIPRFGHSMIIDPWGTVIAAAGPDGDGVIVAELDLAAQRSTRRTLPALDHRDVPAIPRQIVGAGRHDHASPDNENPPRGGLHARMPMANGSSGSSSRVDSALT